MKHKTQKKPKPKTAKTAEHNCAYVMVKALLIIFPVILQTVINLRMLSIGWQGALLTHSLTHSRYTNRNTDSDTVCMKTYYTIATVCNSVYTGMLLL